MTGRLTPSAHEADSWTASSKADVTFQPTPPPEAPAGLVTISATDRHGFRRLAFVTPARARRLLADRPSQARVISGADLLNERHDP